jgi:hypothetical protein
MTLLKHAVAKGYKNATHMKQAPDLAPLRARRFPEAAGKSGSGDEEEMNGD